MGFAASIIIPVYNAERTLRRCVESIALGRERNIQILLVEDGSRDGSWKLCQELAAEFGCVTCLRNEANKGVSHSRNRGLEAAEGAYILFADSDDWVSGRYVQALLALARENPESLPICAMHFIDHVHNSRRDYCWDGPAEVPRERFFDLAQASFLQNVWNKAFRRDIIQGAGLGFDEKMCMGEDYQFVLDYMQAMDCRQCTILNEPLYYYIRWNRNSLMSQYGFAQAQAESRRLDQLHRLSGLTATTRRDEMALRSRRNGVYHIVRSPHHSRREKLAAIEEVWADGHPERHYRQQSGLRAKETLTGLAADIRSLPAKVRDRWEQLQQRRLQKQLRRTVTAENVTILSQNCIGGVVYHDLGQQFLSPTINTFIPEPDFMKLVLNLGHYMQQELVMAWGEEYPVGMLGDVQIHFMHYDTCAQAKAAWNRRRERIRYDKILVLATDRDGFDETSYGLWKQIPYPKLLFTARECYTQDALCLPEFAAQGSWGQALDRRKLYHKQILRDLLNRM